MKEEAQGLMDRMLGAYRKGDAAACAALFTEDARLLSPYAPEAQGRAAIEALHRDWTDGGAGGKSLTVLETASAGDMGWCLVTYSEGEAAGGGKTLAILQRQPDGGWLISHCSMTVDVPPRAGD